MDFGDALHFLHAKEFAIELIECRLGGLMAAFFDPKQTFSWASALGATGSGYASGC